MSGSARCASVPASGRRTAACGGGDPTAYRATAPASSARALRRRLIWRPESGTMCSPAGRARRAARAGARSGARHRSTCSVILCINQARDPRRRWIPTVALITTNKMSMINHITRRNSDSAAVVPLLEIQHQQENRCDQHHARKHPRTSGRRIGSAPAPVAEHDAVITATAINQFRTSHTVSDRSRVVGTADENLNSHGRCHGHVKETEPMPG